jgi:hypothetical protein
VLPAPAYNGVVLQRSSTTPPFSSATQSFSTTTPSFALAPPPPYAQSDARHTVGEETGSVQESDGNTGERAESNVRGTDASENNVISLFN